MELQEIADKVVRGLAAQNWQKSVNHLGQCYYRGESGCKCPVGHIIPDEEYKECFELEAVILEPTNIKEGHFLNHYLWEKFNFFTIRFLSKLQNAHDHAYLIPDDDKWSMKNRIKVVLAEYGLSWPANVPADA